MAATSKWGDDMRKRLCAELSLTQTDAMACEAVGISITTFKRWLRNSDDGDPLYKRFRTDVTEARGRRFKSVLMRLPGYKDWRADDAYLKHVRAVEVHVARSKQAKAEARRACAEADRSESLAGLAKLKLDAEVSREADGGGLSRLLVPEDVLELIARQDPELFEKVESIFQSAGVAPMIRGDLGAGITLKDLQDASPSPIPEEVS